MLLTLHRAEDGYRDDDVGQMMAVMTTTHYEDASTITKITQAKRVSELLMMVIEGEVRIWCSVTWFGFQLVYMSHG